MYKYIDDYLMHYGVRGMKWKNRKAQIKKKIDYERNYGAVDLIMVSRELLNVL